MSFFERLGFGRKSEPAVPSELAGKLPQVNAFVDIAIGGSLVRESVPIDAITSSALILRCEYELDCGTVADFLYTNASGKYRFRTACAKVEGQQAYFALPSEIRTIEKFSTRRTAERIPWVIQVQWRYAPDGTGFGEFLPASMMDVSRGGASLVVGRPLKVGSQVEVRFVLNSNRKPFVELCEVMRASKIETSEKHGAGIRFLKIDPKDERMLIASLEERRSLRRERGIV